MRSTLEAFLQRPVSRRSIALTGPASLFLAHCARPISCSSFKDKQPQGYGLEEITLDCGLNQPHIKGKLTITLKGNALSRNGTIIHQDIPFSNGFTLTYDIGRIEDRLYIAIVSGYASEKGLRGACDSQKDNVDFATPHVLETSWENSRIQGANLDTQPLSCIQALIPAKP